MSNLIADLFAKVERQLFWDTLSERNRRNSSWLRDTHEKWRSTFFSTVVLELPRGWLRCL